MINHHVRYIIFRFTRTPVSYHSPITLTKYFKVCFQKLSILTITFFSIDYAWKESQLENNGKAVTNYQNFSLSDAESLDSGMSLTNALDARHTDPEFKVKKLTAIVTMVTDRGKFR